MLYSDGPLYPFLRGLLPSFTSINLSLGVQLNRRPTTAVIDTEALRFNYKQLKDKAAGGADIMAVVKSNAYGHGDVEVARALAELGCGLFGVAIPEEGARLREAGIESAIVLLSSVTPGQVDEIFAHDLIPAVFDMDSASRINDHAIKSGCVKDIHLKIDTGMGRLGVRAGELKALLEGLKNLKALNVAGVYSHFVEMEAEEKAFSVTQLALFTGAVAEVRAAGFTPRYLHMANSAAVASFAESHFNLVRPGIMLYGSYPAPHLASKIDLRPVMRLETVVLSLKRLPTGTPVSYGRSFVTTRDSLIAVLPIGYGDGLPRSLSGHGTVLVRGVRVPMVGRICMDFVMCDVTDVGGVRVGDTVVVLGSGGAETITAEDIAEKVGTISYEIFCNITARVPRVYA